MSLSLRSSSHIGSEAWPGHPTDQAFSASPQKLKLSIYFHKKIPGFFVFFPSLVSLHPPVIHAPTCCGCTQPVSEQVLEEFEVCVRNPLFWTETVKLKQETVLNCCHKDPLLCTFVPNLRRSCLKGEKPKLKDTPTDPVLASLHVGFNMHFCFFTLCRVELHVCVLIFAAEVYQCWLQDECSQWETSPYFIIVIWLQKFVAAVENYF